MLNLYVKSKMLIADLKKNIEGASLIEYSILIGLITAAVIATIVLVGNRIEVVWSNLESTMDTQNVGDAGA